MSRILVVDDHKEFRRMVSRLLNQEGYDVITADSGVEAIGIIQNQNPDLVLTDIQMPDKDGLTLLRESKDMGAGVDFLILTGHSDESTAIACLQLGAVDYLLKPLENPEILIMSVRRALQKKELETLVSQQTEDLANLNQNLMVEIEKRKEAEEKFRSMVETSSDWIWETDHNAVYTYVSPKIRELLGYTPEEILGKTPFDLMPEDEASRVSQLFADIVKSKKAFQYLENKNLHKDGTLIILETSGIPIMDQDNNLVGYRGIDRDATERIQAEEQLRKLSMAVEQSDSTIMIANHKGNIDYVNPAFYAISGYTPDEVTGENPRLLKSGEHPDSFYKELWDTISSGENWRGEIVNKKKSGEHYWERVIISPVMDSAEKITHYVAVKEDITDRKNAEAENERLISELKDALEQVNQLHGLIPICASCKKIRDDEGYWNNLEAYIEKHSDAKFSHGICGDCAEDLYGDYDWFNKYKDKKADQS